MHASIVMHVRYAMVPGMEEIQRADNRSRRLAILTLVIVLLGGAVLSVQFEAWLTEVRGMPVEAARESLITVFSWSVGIGVVAIFLVGWYSWRVGRHVRRTLRFPPPDAMVLRDTVILSGQAAASRGLLLQVLGVMFVFCAVGIAVVSWWVLKMLGSVHS